MEPKEQDNKEENDARSGADSGDSSAETKVVEKPDWFLSFFSLVAVVVGPLITGCCCVLHGKIGCCASAKSLKGYEMVGLGQKNGGQYDGDDEDEDFDGEEGGIDEEEKATLDMLERYRDKLDQDILKSDGSEEGSEGSESEGFGGGSGEEGEDAAMVL